MRAWWGFKSEGGLTISLPWYTTLSWSFREKFGGQPKSVVESSGKRMVRAGWTACRVTVALYRLETPVGWAMGTGQGLHRVIMLSVRCVCD